MDRNTSSIANLRYICGNFESQVLPAPYQSAYRAQVGLWDFQPL